MKQNKQLIEAWRNGVRLRDAWWQFAGAPVQKEYFDLKSEGLHLDLEHSLKVDLTHRLYSGDLRAIGVESESDSGPNYIPNHYFLKTVKIDWDKDTVAALDKEFYNVAVQSEREPFDEVSSEAEVVDPRPPGRLSKAPEIERAIDVLLERGIEVGKLPRPEAFTAIRDAASELNSNIDIGFSDPVLQRVLFRRFGARR